MLHNEIKDAVGFEVTLSNLLLDRSWAHKYTATLIISGKSSVTMGGVIKITDKHLQSDDYKALRQDIRHQIAHLVSGVQCNHNFNWQFIANKLGVKSELIKLKAKEVVECEYCNKLTVLISPKRCAECKHIEDAVLLNEETALKVLRSIGAI